MRLGLGLGLNRITSVLGRIPGYSALVQWFKGTATDGILQDRIGKFPATERYAGKKFVGDGSAYVVLASTVNLGTSHVIEFEAVRPVSDTRIIIGKETSSTTYISIPSTNRLVYRINGVEVSTDISSAPITLAKYKIIRNETNVDFYVDDVKYGNTEIMATNEIAIVSTLFTRGVSYDLIWNQECSYISFGTDENSLHTFPFEMEASSDLMNSIPPTGEEPITGTIINNDGARIVADDSVEQYFNVRGGARAKALGKNLFNEDTITFTESGSYFVFTTDLTAAVKDGYEIQAGQSYTASCIAKTLVNVESLRARVYYTDATFTDFLSNLVGLTDEAIDLEFIPTKEVDRIAFIRGTAGNDLHILKGTFQLEEGTTPTTYEAWRGYHYTNDGLNPVRDGNVGIKTDDGDLNFYLANGDRASVVYHGPVGNDLTECDIAGTPTVGGDYLIAPVDPAIYRVSNATINNITNEWYDDTDPTALTALIVAKSSLTGLKNDSNQQFTRGTGTTIDELATFNAPQTGNTLTRILAYFGL